MLSTFGVRVRLYIRVLQAALGITEGHIPVGKISWLHNSSKQWRLQLTSHGTFNGDWFILGGLWDLVTTYRGYPNYKLGYNPSYEWLRSPMGLQVLALPFTATTH